jgi:hypothetical protein
MNVVEPAKNKPGLTCEAGRWWGVLVLSQAEERQDRENNNNQTDDVDDLVHG